MTHPPVRRRRTWDRVRAVLAVGTVLGLGTVGTLAVWTDESTATSGTFSTGTVDLKVGNPAVDNNPPQFSTDLALSQMAPGSTKDAVLRVTNAGTLPVTYTLASTATNTGTDQLGSAMNLQVHAGTSCSGTPINTPQKLHGTAFSSPRALAAGATESLCFRAVLPTTAPSVLQGKNTQATFTLTATNS